MPTLPDSGFSRIAPLYDILAKLVFGKSLQKAQLYLLPYIPENSKVLLIGGGSGWLLEQLIFTGKYLDILYVDAAPGMLQLAQKKYSSLKATHNCQVEFRLGTELSVLPTEQFDIIVTPFLLDLFPAPRLQQLMQKLATALHPKGLWLFADFWPENQPPVWWQKLLIWGMYTFFGIVSDVQPNALPDYAPHFDRLGLQEIANQSFYAGFVQAKVYTKR